MLSTQRTLFRIVQSLLFFAYTIPLNAQISFSAGQLSGTAIVHPTSLQFGPDGKLYVAVQGGTIYRYTISKTGNTQYKVISMETINLVKNIPNHDDNGKLNLAVNTRQVTGLLVTGTSSAPKVYVTSSDPRIGGAEGSPGTAGDGDTDLDTNSGILSLLSWSTNGWTKTDLVRGMPRSEENHAQNGMALNEKTNTLYITSGGSTNAGSPSVKFAMITEYALSACILKVDLTQLDSMPLNGTGNDTWVYDLPTLDDPTRSNTGTVDVNDPFGGNDGLNQAKIIAGGPVQVFSPGYRNAYDIVLTKTTGKADRLYTIDNGANQGWGGYPDQEATPDVTNNYVSGEPGSNGPGIGDAQVNNQDNLHLVFKPGMSAPIYGGHPCPIRANPAGAGLFRKTAAGSFFETAPTTDWPPVPTSMANPVESDYHNPGINDGAITTFLSSTNGLTEYTSTGFFNGEMAGDLLAASFDGNIYRLRMSSDGMSVTSKTIFASGFGSIPLDVTTQGDNDVYPGTVWACDYVTNGIYVFEPVGSSTLPTWTQQQPSDNVFPEPRHENAFTECNGKFYLIGGRGSKPVAVYDPVAKTWGTAAPLPNNMELHHFQAVTVGNKIYVLCAFAGVYPGETPVGDILVYDAVSNIWSVLPGAIPVTRRRGSAATAVHNGKIYVAGGIMNGHNSGTVNWTDVFDPATNTWTSLANAPHLRDHVQGAVINGKLYLAGGRRTSASTGNIFNDTEAAVDVFDIASNTWTTLPVSANLPIQRAGMMAVNYNNKLLVAGGESAQSLAHNESQLLDPATATWSPSADLITGRHGTQALLYNGEVYTAAGSSTQGGNVSSELNTLERFAKAGLVCSGNNTSTTMDDDLDSYSNKDEADNGTDPCSSASKPKDNDKDGLSDRNDPDDDNDGIPDVNDPFHVDRQNGNTLFPPINYPLLNGNPGTGLFGMGFTGLMRNGTNPDSLYDPLANGFIMGGAVGIASIPAGPGSALTNNQMQAFQFGIKISGTTPLLTVESALAGPFFNGAAPTGLKDEMQGIYIGNGDQDNYLFAGITPNAGDPSVIVIIENAGVATTALYPVANLLAGNVTIYLEIDAPHGKVQPKYKRSGDAAPSNAGPAITLAGELLQTIQGSRATAIGLLASSRNGSGFSASWDYININPTTAASVKRINVGGGAVSTGGQDWQADQYYSANSYTYSTTTGIGNTTIGPVYQNERYGSSFGYAIPVANGSYELRLHFVELYWSSAGQRVFHVNAENGQGRIDNLDIFATTGKNTALLKTLKVNVTDGVLNVDLTAVKDMAELAGLEISASADTAAPPPPPPPPPPPAATGDLRINNGGPSLTAGGYNWLADKYFQDASSADPSRAYATTAAISGTSMPAIYQSERYGTAFSYNVPLPNGKYRLRLHFSENYWTGTGSRLFNVNVENEQATLSNFDIFAAAGARTALVKEFPVTLSDGTLNISFSAVKDKAKISAIEILADSTTTPAPSPAGSFMKINAAAPTSVINNETWVTDRNYVKEIGNYTSESSTTALYGTAQPIANTSNPTIYQTERFGKSFGYEIPLASGTYTVRLHFTEQYWNSAGARIFSVSLENGQQMLSSVDIFQLAGGKLKALVRELKVKVADSVLNIAFTAQADNAEVCAIEIIADSAAAPPPPPPAPAPATARINNGGPAISSGGLAWSADQYYATTGADLTATYTSSASISGTSYPEIYKTERYGSSFRYEIPVSNGSYQVRLHFAELYWSAAGQRVFNVSVENGQAQFPALDLYATAGKNTALVKTATVTVADGKLTVDLNATKDKAKISAIEVIPSTASAGKLDAFDVFGTDSTQLQAKIIPNPSSQYFTLQMPGTGPYDVRITDAKGRFIRQLKGIMESQFRFGAEWPAGSYFVEVKQGAKRTVLQAVKL